MTSTVVIGRLEDAVGGVLRLEGGAETWLDTVYVLALPEDLPDDHPVWSVRVEVRDGPGDALCELSKGDDWLSLGAGSDWAKLGCGSDMCLAGPGENLVMGGCGDDRIYSGDGDDILVGGYDHDLLASGAGDDQIFGSHGVDDLRGGPGRDALFGGAGDDVLRGGEDADTYLGGEGVDLFIVRPDEGDRVLDFEQGDTLAVVIDGVEVEVNPAEWLDAGGFVVAQVVEVPVVQASDGATS